MALSHDDAFKALGLTDLHIAVVENHPRRALSLLGGGNRKEILEGRDNDGATPLMIAVLLGRLAIAKLLLRKQASVKSRDKRSYRALHYAKASLFKSKLTAYQRLGLPPISRKQIRKRLAIRKIIRYPAARRSRFVSNFFPGVSVVLLIPGRLQSPSWEQ